MKYRLNTEEDIRKYAEQENGADLTYLDTLIQQKREEFNDEYGDGMTPPKDLWSYFIESTIREVAGMVCEEIVPEEQMEPGVFKDDIDSQLVHENWFGYYRCRAKLLTIAKEKGFIK